VPPMCPRFFLTHTNSFSRRWRPGGGDFPRCGELTDFDSKPIQRKVQHITWDPIMAEKGGFKHFMLKEIYEQR
jgi:hypothetical protein